MISILLASILVGGLFYMASGQSQAYRTQYASITTQQNLASAIEFMSRQVRLAGYGFGLNCVAGNVKQWDGSGGCSGTGGTKAASLTGFRTFNNCNLYKTAPVSCPDGSDVDSVMVTYEASGGAGGSSGIAITAPAPSSSAEVWVNNPGGISSGDVLVLSQPGAPWCSVIKATGAPTQQVGKGYKVPHSPDGSYNPPISCNIFPPGGFTAGARVMRFGANSAPRYFAVDTDAKPPRLVTWTTMATSPKSDLASLEVVADGIEDMQVAYACDDNADGLHTEGSTNNDRKSDEWAFNVAGETSPPTCSPAAISIIRITLIARNAGAEPGMRLGFRPAAEDRAAGTPTEDLAATGGVGTYVRRVLTTSVVPRNIR